MNLVISVESEMEDSVTARRARDERMSGLSHNDRLPNKGADGEVGQKQSSVQ